MGNKEKEKTRREQRKKKQDNIVSQTPKKDKETTSPTHNTVMRGKKKTLQEGTTILPSKGWREPPS